MTVNGGFKIFSAADADQWRIRLMRTIEIVCICKSRQTDHDELEGHRARLSSAQAS
jgi:hypothetical protein